MKYTKTIASLLLTSCLGLNVANAQQLDRDQRSASTLIAYTTEARDQRGGTAQIRALIRQGLANANEALDNSFVGIHWGEGTIIEVDYNDSTLTTVSTTLSEWTDGDEINTVEGDTVDELVDDRFLDLQCLICDWSGSATGLARVLGRHCIVRLDAVEFLTMAHELSHLYNSAHREGHQFSNGRVTVADDRATSQSDRVPFFSNPAVTYNGEAAGSDDDDNASRMMVNAARQSFRETGIYPGAVIGLQSNTGYFASGENGNSAMSASRSAVGRWEAFTVGRAGSQWTFRGSGGFVSSEDGRATGMLANRASVGSWERFNVTVNSASQITVRPTDTISLNGVGGNVSSNNNLNGDRSLKMTADRPRVGAWEDWIVWTQ